MLSSCSIPITFSLFNNTGSDVILVLTNNKEIHIKPGKAKKTNDIDSSFFIDLKDKSLTYEIPLLNHSLIKWAGWGPWSKRMFYAQIEPDGKIWVLKNKTKIAIKKFTAQPEGFPLVPNT